MEKDNGPDPKGKMRKREKARGTRRRGEFFKGSLSGWRMLCYYLPPDELRAAPEAPRDPGSVRSRGRLGYPL